MTEEVHHYIRLEKTERNPLIPGDFRSTGTLENEGKTLQKRVYTQA